LRPDGSRQQNRTPQECAEDQGGRGFSVSTESTCRNCGAELIDRYCHRCGQDSTDPPGDAPSLFGVLAASVVGMESRAFRSFLTLLFRPGRLTRAYVQGQRVRYSSPVQLYLWCTAAFFLTQSFFPVVRLDPETGRVVSSLSSVSIGTGLSTETLARLAAQGTPLPVFAERFDAAATAYFPILLLALVVAAALLLAVQFWREPAIKHAVFALHWCAFYFALEVLRRPLQAVGNWGGVASALSTLIALSYLGVAMHVVYERRLLATVARALLTTLAFAALLGGWLWSTTALAGRLA